MNGVTRDVVVVGGGISGLTLAWHLHRARVDVCLVEADDIVGGCTRTERRDSFLLEKGPFNVIVRDPTFEALIASVEDEVQVITASREARKRYIYRHGRLRIVPTNPVSLATTRLLTPGGRLRLLSGLLVSRRGSDREETIEQVTVRRFGQDVSDTMVSAVIAGIFAGDIRKLSLKACFPSVARIDREARSLIGYGIARAFGKKNRKHRRRYRGLVSIDGGLGALTETLGRSLGSNLLTNYRVETIRESDGGYEVVQHDNGDTPGVIRCRRVVIASPVTEAGRLLAPLIPEALDDIRTIDSTSLIVLNLGFRRADVGHSMEGYGFLVPHHETDFPLMGVLWAGSIFPHHAPADHRLIRVFIGGAHNLEAVSRPDDELLDLAMRSSRGLLQLTGDPVLVDICRYPAAIPQYHLGHVEKIDRLRSLIASKTGLHLAGNYLGGVSLNDCIRVSTELAVELIAETTSVVDTAWQSNAAVVEAAAV